MNPNNGDYNNPVIAGISELYVEYSFFCNWVLSSLIIFFGLSFFDVPSFWLWKSETAFNLGGFLIVFFVFVPITYLVIIIPTIIVVAVVLGGAVDGFTSGGMFGSLVGASAAILQLVCVVAIFSVALVFLYLIGAPIGFDRYQ